MLIANVLRFPLSFFAGRLPQRAAPRSREQLREHYLIERELAERLCSAPVEERPALYMKVYDELLRRVPHHPMLQVRVDPRELGRRAAAAERTLAFLARFFRPGCTFMEIGAGDCAVSVRAAAQVKQVYAIEVSAEIVAQVRAPGNLAVVLCNGLSIPVAPGSVDVAFSDQLMEHLHPDDAALQLASIYRSLAPGGVYLCVTPNRLYGPRDISEHFDEVATGLHLKEYSAREIRKVLHAAGFSRVRFYAGARGLYVAIPYFLVAAVEGVLEKLPYGLRKLAADTGPLRALLGLRVAATK
ncbi:MAG TPA: class I SAM-dependent methyltransferase [Burkholderiales bacterium]|nr:class I SAM-dependent methyltransferase [Burkholderiales bacterium]